MATIEMEKQHSLDDEQARQRVEEIGRRLAEKHGLQGGWQADGSYSFSRTGVKGRVRLSARVVRVEVDLSLMLRPLKAKIEQKLREGLEREFA